MSANISLMVLLLISHSSNGKGAKMSQRYTIRHEGVKMKSAFREVMCSSIAACSAVCSQDTACLTVSFRDEGGRCLLGANDVTNAAHINLNLVPGSGWVTISKVVYKVFNAQSPLGRHQVTFPGAVALCEERDTVLATKAEVLDSRAIGLNYCACGWMYNGTQGVLGFVLQTINWACWGSFNPSIIYCYGFPKGNAWCRL